MNNSQNHPGNGRFSCRRGDLKSYKMRTDVAETCGNSRAGRLRNRRSRERIKCILPVKTCSVKLKAYIDCCPRELVVFDQLPGVTQSLTTYIVQHVCTQMYCTYMCTCTCHVISLFPFVLKLNSQLG